MPGPDPDPAVSVLDFWLSAGLGGNGSVGEAALHPADFKDPGAAWSPINSSSLETSRRSRWVGMESQAAGFQML